MNQDDQIIYKLPGLTSKLVVLVCVLLLVMFYDGLAYMVKLWSSREEFSHGFIIPLVSAFLIWQKQNSIYKTKSFGAWSGSIIIIAGLALYYAGELSTLYVLVQVAFVIVLAGLFFALFDWKNFRTVWVAFFILLFMIPLPNFLLNTLSLKLQLISSQLGVFLIRLFDISVFLEGNVIDLGAMKLQVVEACSGLNYLFPLMTLGFIAAYFYKGLMWHRVILFLSTIPITVLMNSFRIGMVGVMVEYWGKSMAEGFLHYFEGWVLFILCTGTLIAEMWLFNKFSKGRRPLRDVFAVDFPSPIPTDVVTEYRKLTPPVVTAISLVLVFSSLSLLLPERNEINPARQYFASFPTNLDAWVGNKGKIEKQYIEALMFDDYVISDYVNKEGKVVNLYVAYYESQRKGQSAHSPRTCIPGGGWDIKDIARKNIDNVSINGENLVVNRTLIQKEDEKQLVYYWFQQRGRVVTNEYLVKWFIFLDAMTKNRTDGALVRLTTYVGPGQSVEQADNYLSSFAKTVSTQLHYYIPD